MQKALRRKFKQLLEKNSRRGKAPDVDAMLRETKAQARTLKLAGKKQRPPTQSECRSSQQSETLNCKKYIALRMEKAGQNSEYDSTFFYAMYRKAQPQPLRHMVKKVKMIHATEEASRDATS